MRGGAREKDGGVKDGKDDETNNIATSANYESAVLALATSALSQVRWSLVVSR